MFGNYDAEMSHLSELGLIDVYLYIIHPLRVENPFCCIGFRVLRDKVAQESNVRALITNNSLPSPKNQYIGAPITLVAVHNYKTIPISSIEYIT